MGRLWPVTTGDYRPLRPVEASIQALAIQFDLRRFPSQSTWQGDHLLLW